MRPTEAPAPDAGVDFDVHGLAGVRLLGATPRDVGTVVRQLGPMQGTLTREPDITVRFVDRLPLRGPLRYVHYEDGGFTEDGFFVLRSKGSARTRVRIPFDAIGKRCDIVCERGLPAVPLLLAIVNLTVLARGTLPLHATAFGLDGRGVLSTGWSKGGKTESLLAFLPHGARYIGDEWIYLTADGEQMYGIPEPIRIWYWQVRQLAEIGRSLSPRTRARLAALDTVARGMRSLAETQWGGSGSALASVVRRAAPVAARQPYVQLPPERLPGAQSVVNSARPDTVFFMMSHDSPEIVVEPVDPMEVAERMPASLQFERAPVLSYYDQFRFAFPDRSCEVLERAEQLERTLLRQVLAGKRAHLVRHPYPASLAALHEAMAPYA